MKKLLLVSFLFIFFNSGNFAQSNIPTGAVAIVGFNSDTGSTIFAFVLLKDVAASTSIRFTDCGWKSSGGFTNTAGDGGLTWTAAQNYYAGDVIFYTGIGGEWTPYSMGSSNDGFSLSTSGDEIFAFKGDYTNPKLIYGIYFAGNSWPSRKVGDDPYLSNLPAGLLNIPFSSIAVGNFDNGYYSSGANPDLTALRAAISSSSNWTTVNGTSQDLTTIFSSPLPVELNSFTASVLNNIVNLHWSTATEVKNYGWYVERSEGNNTWTKIGFVQGAGSSNSPKDYKFADNNMKSGNYSYRLKQIDIDGQYKYSKSVDVSIGNMVNGYSLSQNYPNPFNPTTMIRFVFENNTTASLKVYNSIGQEVATLFHGIAEGGRQYDVTFNASKLSSGVYFYKLEGNGKSEVKKMMLMK